MSLIQEALIKVQYELKAPKGQYNSFGKYNYRSCEDILESVKPLLSKHNLSLTISDEVVEVGNRVYVKATCTLTSAMMRISKSDKDGDKVIDENSSIVVTAYAREEESKKGMDASQVTGAASSYARKYALNGLFLIDDTKDADTDAYTKQNTPKSKKFLCDSCGSLIQDANGATAEAIAMATHKKYGKCLCYNCITKQNEEAKKNVETIKDSGIPVEVHE